MHTVSSLMVTDLQHGFCFLNALSSTSRSFVISQEG